MKNKLKEHDAREFVDSLPYIGEYCQPDTRMYLKKDVDEIITELKNLLAIIHRDGGHYTEKHGITKACGDGRKVVVALRSKIFNLGGDPNI